MSELSGQDSRNISSQELLKEVEGKTLASTFLDVSTRFACEIALRTKSGDDFVEYTWEQYRDQVARIASALTSLGVSKGDRVALMVKNSVEFHFFDVAAIFIGATPLSIYNSSAPDQITHVINSSEARIILVENDAFADKVLNARSMMPSLKTIVIRKPQNSVRNGAAHPDTALTYTTSADSTSTNNSTDSTSVNNNYGAPATNKADSTSTELDTVSPEINKVSFESLLSSNPADLESLANSVAPEDLLTVIYTSGTTGPPKGVSLTHTNIAFAMESYSQRCPVPLDGLTTISYLPMAHLAERLLSHYMGIYKHMVVTCCPEATELMGYLGTVHPEVLFGVPRVFEKAYNGVNATLANDPEKQRQFNEGLELAKPIAMKIAAGEQITDDEKSTYDFLDAIAFSTVRGLLGLDKIKVAASGAAPLPAYVLEWFRTIGLPLSEIYGMSESSVTMTWSPSQIKLGSVGKAMPGVELTTADDGEILTRGSHVFGGYMNDPQLTSETLDEQGWLHTGDIGSIDEDGYLTILDRKKELIITAGGKNISPNNIETELKRHPLIGQACVVGDSKPYITALVVLDPEVTPVWLNKHEVVFESLESAKSEPTLVAEIENFISSMNTKFSNVEQVKKWTILSDEWPADGEELTPTMKLKRRNILTKYQAEISAMYK